MATDEFTGFVAVLLLTAGAWAAPVPTVDLASQDDCSPVVSWTVTSDDGVASSVVQASYRADGGFADVSSAFAGSGSFVFTNAAATVAVPVWYRLRCELSAGGETVSDAVRYVRVRQLDRAEGDQTVRRTGVTLLDVHSYCDDPCAGYDSATLPFDGDLGTFIDVMQTDAKCSPYEVVLGVRLPEASHVTDVFAYPRATIPSRLGCATILGCVSDESFAAKETVVVAARQTTSAARWYRYRSTDTNTLFRQVFAYDGPLAGGLEGFYGNVAELRFYGWSPSDEDAAGLAVDPPSADWTSMSNTAPVVSWSVSGEIVTSSRVEYAFAPDGPYYDLGEAQSGAGSFAVTNAEALLGIATYYRVRYTSLAAGECVTEPIRSVRVRQLERAESNQAKLRSGVSILDGRNYTTQQEYWGSGTEKQSFDGDLGTWADLSLYPSYLSVEVNIGVRLPEASHVTDVFLYPRPDNLTRGSKARVLACTDIDAYTNAVTDLLVPKHTFTSAEWYHATVTNVETLYQYVFAYDGPLWGGLQGFAGNMSEIRFFGWSPTDEYDSGRYLRAPSVARTAITDTTPVVTWTVPSLVVTNFQLECSYRPEGPFRALGPVFSGTGTFVYTNTSAVLCLPCYYRVRYVSVCDGEGATEVASYSRARQLERAESDQTKLRTGVTTLPGYNYSTQESKPYASRSVSLAFDGDESTYPDIFALETYASIETVVGVRLPEAAHVTEFCILPRTDGSSKRAGNAYFVGCTDETAYAEHALVTLATPDRIDGTVWRTRASSDDTPVEYVFAYSGPLTGGTQDFNGNICELRFYGWTESDVESVLVQAPAGVTATPDEQSVRIGWTSAVNAESLRLERRLAGTEVWTVAAENIDPSAGSVVDTGLRRRTDYEYRLISVGLSGYMESPASVLQTKTLGSGFAIFFR